LQDSSKFIAESSKEKMANGTRRRAQGKRDIRLVFSKRIRKIITTIKIFSNKNRKHSFYTISYEL